MTRHDLLFDQSWAMSAVAYLDEINGTHDLDRFLPQWQLFVADKPMWNLEASCSFFLKNIARIKAFIAKDR